MRHYVPVACALLSCGAFECSADDLARAERRAESVGPSIAAVLRETSALTLTQDNGERYWTDQMLRGTSAAMALSQALGERPGVSYAVLFNDIDEVVIRALARAHAATGSPDQALAWARRIGSGGNSDPTSDESARAVERRIHALIGVAEGRLDRASGRQPVRVSWEFSD